MKRLIVAFRNLCSNITKCFDAAELVTFFHLPDIKFGRSDSY